MKPPQMYIFIEVRENAKLKQSFVEKFYVST